MDNCERCLIHGECWLCDHCGSCWLPRIVGLDWVPAQCRAGKKLAALALAAEPDPMLGLIVEHPTVETGLEAALKDRKFEPLIARGEQHNRSLSPDSQSRRRADTRAHALAQHPHPSPDDRLHSALPADPRRRGAG